MEKDAELRRIEQQLAGHFNEGLKQVAEVQRLEQQLSDHTGHTEDGFRSRFDGRRVTINDIEQIRREIDQALEAKDYPMMQNLLTEFDIAREKSKQELDAANAEYDRTQRELTKHLEKVAERNKNIPKGKRLISADVDPHLNRIGALFDEEDAKVYEQWVDARRKGFRDPYEARRKRTNKFLGIAAVVIVILLIAWIIGSQ